MLDLYLGIDTGSNTTFGSAPATRTVRRPVSSGFGLNMMGGNLTVLALTPYRDRRIPSSFSGRSATMPTAICAYYNDLVVTWKASDKLTLVTEANWIRDDFDGFFTKGNQRRPTHSVWRSTSNTR